LRVPFKNENGILKKWISRFDVWPYLEKFAEVRISDASFLVKIPEMALHCYLIF
jgi:hypothetical protein